MVVNERIKAAMVRLVTSEGEHLGIISREEALTKARNDGLDLVEVAPEADPPVCKIMDYGKFKYRKQKKQHQAHHRSQLKEIRIGFGTEEHDLAFKAKHVREFLEKHDRVMISMRLKGRQQAHGDLGLARMMEFAKRFEDICKVETPPRIERPSRVSMLLAPK